MRSTVGLTGAAIAGGSVRRPRPAKVPRGRHGHGPLGQHVLHGAGRLHRRGVGVDDARRTGLLLVLPAGRRGFLVKYRP